MARLVAVTTFFLTVIFCHLEAVAGNYEPVRSDEPARAESRETGGQSSVNDPSSENDVIDFQRSYEEGNRENGVRSARVRGASLVRRAQEPFGMQQPRHIVATHLGVTNEFWSAVIVLLLVFGLPTLCTVTLVAIIAWFIVRRRDSKAADLMRCHQRTERSRSMLYSGNLGIGCIKRSPSPVFEVQPADEEFIRIANKHRLSITKY